MSADQQHPVAILYRIHAPTPLETEVRLLRFFMAAQIERDHPVTIPQALDLKLELLCSLEKAVNGNERFSRTCLQIMQSTPTICLKYFKAILGFDATDIRSGLPMSRT